MLQMGPTGVSDNLKKENLTKITIFYSQFLIV